MKFVVFLFRLIVISMLMQGAACHEGSSKELVRSGMAVLPWPKQIEGLYGPADHFIAEEDFSSGVRQWNSEVYFGGRYRLTLQVNIQIDRGRKIVVKAIEEPNFYLTEFRSIDSQDGRLIGAKTSHQWTLDRGKWDKVVSSGGNWSTVGISIDPTAVPGFEEYISKWRGHERS